MPLGVIRSLPGSILSVRPSISGFVGRVRRNGGDVYVLFGFVALLGVRSVIILVGLLLRALRNTKLHAMKYCSIYRAFKNINV